jgi:Mg-chelatase subunit ChlD
MKRSCILIALCAVTAWTVGLFADEILLKDGKKVVGEIVKEGDDSVTVKGAGGMIVVPRKDIDQIVRKADARKTYQAKVAAVAAKSVAGHLDLGKWCLAQGLIQEARREFELVLILDPQNPEVQALLQRAGVVTPEKVVLQVEMTLSDSSLVKGNLVTKIISLETPYGLLRIPAASLVSITTGAQDVIQTENFKATGQLVDEPIIVDSKLGRLSIAKKDLKTLQMRRLSPEETAQLKFRDAMAALDRNGLDVVIVLDCTDSMIGVQVNLRKQCARVWEIVRRYVPSAQIGVVCYRDRKEFDPKEFTWLTEVHPLTSDVAKFKKTVDDLQAIGGGDVPEAVYDGLADAIAKSGWREKSRKIMILIGDAPPHPQDDGIAKTVQLAADWRKSTNGVLYAIDSTGFDKLMPEWVQIARAGGGRAFTLNDEKQIAQVMLPLIFGPEWRDRMIREFEASPADETPTPAPPPPGPAPKPPDAGIIKDPE